MIRREYRCGHPRTAENIKVVFDARRNAYCDRCRTCWNELHRTARARIPQDLRRLEYRVKILPKQLAAARAKLARLENEARELGFHDLLENP